MCEVLKTYNPLLKSEQLNRLNASYEISFALDRMYKNILLINNGLNAKTIHVSNTTLYQVASEQYNDASLWTYIAQVNNLVDPEITTSMTIVVPPKPANNLRFGT